MSRYGIETTQHVQIDYDIASVMSRLGAFLVDSVLLFIYVMVTTTTMAYLNNFIEGGSAETIALLLATIPTFLYYPVIEISWNGYTVGKWLVGIRVVQIDGTRAKMSSYIIRWFIGLFEIFISSGSIAVVAILINGKGQRLGDMAARTCVIQERKRVKLDETLFEEVEQEYEVLFPQAKDLSDEDVGIIREVIAARSEYDQSTWFVMLQRTRKLIEEKIKVKAEDMNALDFLNAIIKDYNALH